MNIQIALIGGQVYPAYLGIADQQPDSVILVHSANTKNEAERIKSELPDRDILLMEFEPVDIERIFRQTRELLRKVNAEHNYTINITSGTKLWTIAFYECFKNMANAKLMYIDQNNRIYDLSTMDSRLSTVQLNMDLLFRLNGTNIKSNTDFNEYSAEDLTCLKQIKSLRKNSYQLFNTMSIPQKMHIFDSKEGTYSFCTKCAKESGELFWNRKDNSIIVEMTTMKGKRRERLKSPHVFDLFFHTGWFEYEVALMLSNWKFAKEIRLNVCFPYQTDNNAKNEIDIIVNTGNRLLFVECKTQIFDITDIDKFRTAVKNYGGMGCKALFITEAKMKSKSAEKCRDSGILSFSMSDCGNNFLPSEMLYTMLEQEMFEINKK